MQIQQPDILKTLEDAQLAHQAGDFVNALDFYEYFFDHALDADPYALYGVRLSYCLDGWARLTEVFLGAKIRLEEKQQHVIQLYRDTKDSEKFHDYYCISKALNQGHQALALFSDLYAENPKSAEKLSKYVWDDLVKTENWEMCGALLQRPEQKIDEFFAIYDEAQKLKSVEPSFDNLQFDQHLIENLLAGVSNAVSTLRYNDRADEIASIERQFYQTIDSRNDASLSKAVHAKASYLFIGH
ncbi:hypothetical protein N9060_00270 [Arenicella sp.]|nr:hypothetical protein [Arenicella sp.]